MVKIPEPMSSTRLNTPVAAQKGKLAIAAYLQTVARIQAEELVHIGQRNPSEKVLCPRASWSGIGLPIFTRARKKVDAAACSTYCPTERNT